MARDIHSEIDRLTDELASLRRTASRKTSQVADDAVSYIAPVARDVSRRIQHDGQDVIDAVRRNPGTAGAIVGVFALGAIVCFLLSNSSRRW